MRELTYYVACSVDGFIAHNDGSHQGFAQDQEYLTDLFAQFPETVPTHLRDVLGITAENQCFDVVLMGRKTYEIGLKQGYTSPYAHMQQYLFSRSMVTSPDPAVQLVSEGAIAVIKTLKAESGKGIWLCGGGELATTLFAHHLIDRLILKINPFLMGDGIPLFYGVIPQCQLALQNHQIYPNGVALFHYSVV